MVTQLLFGEHFTILEEKEEWIKIKIADDAYECWINHKQYSPIIETTFKLIESEPRAIVSELFALVKNTTTSHSCPVPMGSKLPFLKNGNFSIEEQSTYNIDFASVKNTFEINIDKCLQTAFLYLNTPYLWGGKTPFGIDCSGFTQMVYKLNGYKLLRDASQQASQGEALSFIEESEPGDLAFFDNEEGNIIHVGIMMENNYIIHASGQVRIDRLDHLGIYNADTNRHTHKLRVIKKII